MLDLHFLMRLTRLKILRFCGLVGAHAVIDTAYIVIHNSFTKGKSAHRMSTFMLWNMFM